jgi:GNAT superfamily N-acetyltransferase
MASTIGIVPFRPELASAFAQLNRAWIEELFTIEAADLAVLQDPETSIIRGGGQIFFAIEAGVAVGTAAAIRISPGRVELAKMAVSPTHRGHGLGERLGQAVIDWSRQAGADTIFLVTNSRLANAIRLYQRLGFRHAPLAVHLEYERADVYMELSLIPDGGGRAALADSG